MGKEDEASAAPEPVKTQTPEEYKRGGRRPKLQRSDIYKFTEAAKYMADLPAVRRQIETIEKAGGPEVDKRTEFLREIEKEGPKEMIKLTERLYTPIVESNLRTLDKLLGFQSIYPYESRDTRGRIEGMQDVVTDMYKEVGESEESKKWVRSLEDGINYFDNSFSLLEGYGTSLPYYYGGTDRMGAELYEKPRKIPTMANHNATYTKQTEIPISELEMKECEDIREKVVAYQNWFSNIQMSVGALGQFDPREENNGLRSYNPEEAVGKVSYMEFCDVGSKKKEDIKPEDIQKLTPGKLLLLSYVFNGEQEFSSDTLPHTDDKNYLISSLNREFTEVEMGQAVTLEHVKRIFPKKILQWFTTVESATEKKNYVATMMALLETKAFEELEKNLMEGRPETIKLITGLATKVAEHRKDILQGKLGHADRGFDYKLMEYIVKKGFIEGLGEGSSTEMSWNFEYYKDEKGDLHRRTVVGGINQSGDLYTPRYWLLHKCLYDLNARKRASIWPASIGSFRDKYLETRRPDEKPEVPASADGSGKERLDQVLDDALDKLYGEKSEDQEWAKKVMERINKKMDFSINKEFVQILKKMLWFWETPYQSLRDTSGAGRGAKNRYTLGWPVFLPPEIQSINLLNALKEGETFWGMLCSGKKRSEIPWLLAKDHGYDWWLTNNQMMSRWLKEIVDLTDTYHDRDYPAFYGGVGGLKDLIKRDELGNRGLKLPIPEAEGVTITTKEGNEVYFDEIPEPLLEVITLPMMVVLNLMDKYKIVSEDFATSANTQELFKNEVQDWLVICYYLPQTKPVKAKSKKDSAGKREAITWKFEGYNTAFMKMLWFYARLAYRIGIDYGADFGTDKTNVKSTLTDSFN